LLQSLNKDLLNKAFLNKKEKLRNK